MSGKLLIVEDEFIVANNLRLILEHAGYEVCGIAASVKEARELIKSHQVDLVLLDIYLKGKLTGIDFAKELRSQNIAFVYLSANSNQQILEAAKSTDPEGFVVKPYREKDVLIALDIARYRHKHNRESKRRQEATLYQTINDLVAAAESGDQKFLQLAYALQPFIPFDFLCAESCSKTDTPQYQQGTLRIGFTDYQRIGLDELSTISAVKEPELSRIYLSEKDRTASIRNAEDFESKSSSFDRLLSRTFQLTSKLVFPLPLPGGKAFCLTFFSKNANRYTPEHLALLIYLQESLTVLFENIQTTRASANSQEPMSRRQLPQTRRATENIIGGSSALLHVMDLIAQVAPTDTSVLLLGESGTGKERLAESIHQLSRRSTKPIVKVNCAVLSHSLIESELFGHEKGAFTGAADRKIGKFELASGGTLFLDEIGELPMEQQVKLLRVLQEREIERLGGNKSIQIDVRVIAATNRNLEMEVAEGRFRLDLYYRLNVFPIVLPALRERKEDIPLLAIHFATRFTQKMSKAFHGLSQQMQAELEAYHWPGNIRELENVIEQYPPHQPHIFQAVRTG